MDIHALDETYDTVAFVLDFEAGELDEEQVIAGFQHLIDDGTVWHLQGSYGRTAVALIAEGLCTTPDHVDSEPVLRRPELVGTFCECGASFDPELVHAGEEYKGGYRCAR